MYSLLRFAPNEKWGQPKRLKMVRHDAAEGLAE
jgi:hypothetical protein